MSLLRSISTAASAQPKTTDLPPLGHLPPVCDDFAWQSKLFRRDIKALYESGKTRVTNKFKRLFSSSSPATVKQLSLVTPVSEHMHSSIAEVEAKFDVKENATFKKKTPQHTPKVSISTVATTQSNVFTTESDTRPTTATVSVTQSPRNINAILPELPIPANDTLYSYLHEELALWRKNAARDLEVPERWKLRGITLLLGIIVELSASNPIFNILREGQEATDQISFILGLMRITSSREAEEILTALRQYSGQVSKIPALPYANRATPAEIRMDSAHTNVSLPMGLSHPKLPHTTYLWAAVMIALQERKHTEDIVSEILKLALSNADDDIEQFLVRIGNPENKWWNTGEDDEIRGKLRRLLSPDVEMLLA